MPDRNIVFSLPRDMSDRDIALSILRDITERHPYITPSIAIELAQMLAHIAGGDGRGIYTIVHTR